ncbi:MFS transporter, AAHS family, benzoate transport protein [Quadrisphaera granulorum]|uniref:AAHS family benzoate transporter-like MFS transporter n=1 Tax=Quadrisphaera granulorum TaxID=317664 RepID=A0A316A5Q6_9ACTN|nr:MFS transporter [Quadrisphaera granulorum]PWJ52903.1 AAHS family benzoate transporter-like MFS transporter [Quadrisphaera granulorum]SZE97285.1 MFS transporter, AAHS family, benzoate transport protein [Quadrisphaera granulorum]
MKGSTAAPRHTGHATADRTVLVLAASFAAMEGFDLAVYGVTVPSLLKDPALGANPAAAGSAGALVAVGMLLGAALSAALIRRFGSRALLFGGAALFSVGMLACAVAVSSFELFSAARFVVGVGLGIVLPTVTAYVADVSAPDRRARNVGLMMAGYAGGALMAPLLGAALLPLVSWHWMYVVGVLPALVLLPLAAKRLPESPVTPGHVAHSGSARSGSAPSRGDLLGLKLLLAPGVRLATVLFWVVSFCGLLLVFGISTWLPTIMQAAGYSLGSALLQTAAMWTGAGIGMVLGGRLADRVGVKPVVVGAFLAGTLSLLVMSTAPSLGVLFAAMFVSGLGFIGSQVLTNAFIVTRYPDHLRGPAIGWALSVGRLGAIAGPIIGGAVLASSLGVAFNFYVFAIPGVIGAALAAAVPVIRARRATQQHTTGSASDGVSVTAPATEAA